MGDEETVSVTFSATSSGDDRLSLLRILPKTGSAARGFMRSSKSFSFSVTGLHFEAARPTGLVGVCTSAYAEDPAMMGVSSKLTRMLLLFFVPSSDIVSDTSLGGFFSNSRPAGVTGELPRLDTDGDDFKADLAGELDRGGGWCFSPASSTVSGAKWALRGGLREELFSCTVVRTLPRFG